MCFNFVLCLYAGQLYYAVLMLGALYFFDCWMQTVPYDLM